MAVIHICVASSRWEEVERPLDFFLVLRYMRLDRERGVGACDVPKLIQKIVRACDRKTGRQHGFYKTWWRKGANVSNKGKCFLDGVGNTSFHVVIG